MQGTLEIYGQSGCCACCFTYRSNRHIGKRNINLNVHVLKHLSPLSYATTSL